ncbi:MAG TPA: VCBS repeat-containing protein [Nannocystaceae bacterium]|nr:VCBS repeat-containing protein [Nannocystaceae bacterium]
MDSMPRFDPSPWNLGVPLGALATACGPVIPLETMGPSSISETDPTAPTSDDGGSTDASPCVPPCGYGYVCEAGQCVPQGCLEFGCCYDYPCCFDAPCDDGNYGCSGLGSCGAAAFCEGYECLPILEPPECESPLVFTEVLGPTPVEISTVFALAFMQSDDDAAQELVVGHQAGLVLVDQQAAAQVLPVSYGLVDDIAVADFDGDGDEDLAIELTYAEVALVLVRNDGEGSFYPLGSDEGPVFDVRAGDLDGDGLADLVGGLAFTPEHIVGALPNAGGLTFGSPTLLDVNSPARDLDIGDLDGDGSADVAAVVNTAQEIWYGKPFGSLGSQDVVFTDAQSYDVQMVVADFDGNGFDDLARLVSLIDTTLVDTWSTNGGGLQEAPEWGWIGFPLLSDAGDLDGDGNADLVRVSGNELRIRYGAQTVEMFGCASRIELPIEPYSIAIGDFTGDGADDIAVADAQSLQVYAAVSPP